MGSDCERDPSSASPSKMARRDWMYENNGGTCMAISGLDYCALAADTRLSVGYSIYTCDYSKICKSTDKSVLASSGFQGNIKALQKNLAAKHLKEYMRYKQSKGWKSLVVYNCGIHALGLYTSHFIARGAMVVEYVGEIVGLCVADKREIEYQPRRRLQYKSACYFMKIYKEHIIDATHKSDYGRLFSLLREIYQGEEITYDYHSNHEDEGEKIPCLCNAKNCRLYPKTKTAGRC